MAARGAAHFPPVASGAAYAAAVADTDAAAAALRAAATATATASPAAGNVTAAVAAVSVACGRLHCATASLLGSGGGGGACLCSSAAPGPALPALRGGLACVRLLRTACALGPAPAAAVLENGGLAAALSLLDFLGRDRALRGSGDGDGDEGGDGGGESGSWTRCVWMQAARHYDQSTRPTPRTRERARFVPRSVSHLLSRLLTSPAPYRSVSRAAAKASWQLAHNACNHGDGGSCARVTVWQWLSARSCGAARAAPFGSVLDLPPALAQWCSDDASTAAVIGWLAARLASDRTVSHALAHEAGDLLGALLRLAAPVPGQRPAADADVDWVVALCQQLAVAGQLPAAWAMLAAVAEEPPLSASSGVGAGASAMAAGAGTVAFPMSLEQLTLLHAVALGVEEATATAAPGQRVLAAADCALFWTELARLVAWLSAAGGDGDDDDGDDRMAAPGAARTGAARRWASAGVAQLARLLADDLGVCEPPSPDAPPSADAALRERVAEGLCTVLAREAVQRRAAAPARADGRPGGGGGKPGSASALGAVDCTRLIALVLGQAHDASAADALARACPAFIAQCLAQSLSMDTSAPLLREWSVLCLRQLMRSAAAAAVVEQLRRDVAGAAPPLEPS